VALPAALRTGPTEEPAMFVVCGEALFDVFSAGPTASGLALDARIGGSPFNVALGLARLGQPVAFLGGIERGFLGDRLLRAFADEGISSTCLAMVQARTTLSLVGLDARGVPTYAFYGDGAADRQLLPADLARVPADARVFHFGSYAMVVEPIAGTLRELVRRERGRSLLAYDLNVRLNVEPDAARWREVLAFMASQVDIVKMSDEDLALLYPGEPLDAPARRWQAAGAALVVVTRGGDGALAVVDGQLLQVPAPAVDVVDTVGAGDTFQAAMLAALHERGLATPEGVRGLSADVATEVLGFAARAAALTCGRRGADLPRRAELA
jgi:fructokinase